MTRGAKVDTKPSQGCGGTFRGYSTPASAGVCVSLSEESALEFEGLPGVFLCPTNQKTSTLTVTVWVKGAMFSKRQPTNCGVFLTASNSKYSSLVPRLIAQSQLLLCEQGIEWYDGWGTSS